MKRVRSDDSAAHDLKTREPIILRGRPRRRLMGNCNCSAAGPTGTDTPWAEKCLMFPETLELTHCSEKGGEDGVVSTAAHRAMASASGNMSTKLHDFESYRIR